MPSALFLCNALQTFETGPRVWLLAAMTAEPGENPNLHPGVEDIGLRTVSRVGAANCLLGRGVRDHVTLSP